MTRRCSADVDKDSLHSVMWCDDYMTNMAFNEDSSSTLVGQCIWCCDRWLVSGSEDGRPWLTSSSWTVNPTAGRPTSSWLTSVYPRVITRWLTPCRGRCRPPLLLIHRSSPTPYIHRQMTINRQFFPMYMPPIVQEKMFIATKAALSVLNIMNTLLKTAMIDSLTKKRHKIIILSSRAGAKSAGYEAVPFHSQQTLHRYLVIDMVKYVWVMYVFRKNIRWW